MRVGLVGTGTLGRVHAERLVSGGDVSEIVVFDPDGSAVDRLSDVVGPLTRCASLEDMVRRAPDAVVVTSPSTHHSDQVGFFLEARIPVFCEKPIALDLGDAARLRSLARATNGMVQVGFQRRFSRGYASAKQIIGSGDLGTVHTFAMSSHDRSQPSRQYLRDAGGIFKDLHIHDFDLVRFLFGAEVDEVSAIVAPPTELTGEIRATCLLLRMENGLIGMLSGARGRGDGPFIGAEVVGSRRTLRISPAGVDDEAGAVGSTGAVDTVLEQFADAFRNELDDFLASVARRTTPMCTLEDGIEALRIAVAAERSVHERRPVKLDEVAL